MPGAVIAIDQDRPGGSTSFGTPGVARNDLWLSRTIRPRSTQALNLSQQWTLLDKPPTSTATLNNSAAVTCDFTPDVSGTYRIQLVTNGGGTGNIQILVARVRFDVNGSITNRGWALPAFGEVPPEANYSGNARGWDEPWEFLLTDLLALIISINPNLGGDLSGVTSNAEVIALRNLPINTTAPSTGQYLGWDGTHLTYSTVVSFAAANDLTGTFSSQTVVGWRSHALDATTFGTPPSAGLPIWVGGSTKWEAIAISGDGTISEAGVLAISHLTALAGSGTVLVGVDNTGALIAEAVAPIVAGIHTGSGTIDFGAAPGATTARVTVSGQTGLLAGSVPKAWIMYKDSADNTADEHLAARIYVLAGNIVGTSFDIVAISEQPQVGAFNVAWEWY